MTPTEINKAYATTVDALDKREISTAFDCLLGMIAGGQEYAFMERLESLQDTYHQMLFYYAKGMNDPMQDRIYNELIINAYELSDRVKRKLLMKEVVSVYYSTKRLIDKQSPNLITLAVGTREAAETENTSLLMSNITLLFKMIWTNDYLTQDETDCLSGIITLKSVNNEPQISDYITITGCQIVSALTLSLQETFDRQKLRLLFDGADSDNAEIRIRAMIGLLLSLYKYGKRIDCYEDIRHRLEAVAETGDFIKVMNIVIHRFILSRQTETITTRLKDDIFPEMLKLHPKYNPNSSVNIISPEDFETDMNPEWLEKLSKSDFQSKMEEFNELQEEGADVMHFSFIHLKHFPFFNEPGNWFMPFKNARPAFSGDNTILKALELITGTGFMCNSDMFSFFISLRQISGDEQNKLVFQLEEQMSKVKEVRSAELVTKFDSAEIITGQYIQDLYRFYKLHPRRTDFSDIFAQNLDFHNVSLLTKIFTDKETLLGIAELYLRKDYYEDALTLYSRLAETPSTDDEIIYQKMGYCRQLMGKYGEALHDYERAELFNADSKWLIRRTAQCFRAVKKYDKALEYYLRFDRLEPENISILLSIGSCYLDMKNYDEALKYYFKADYLESKSHKAWRPIAWISFLMRKYELAQNYYAKIIDYNPEYQDYINAGHVELALNNLTGAVDFYKQSVKALNADFNAFIKEFHNDIPTLLAAGIDAKDVHLAPDIVKYNI
ncbi:MAG: tetratricopeptide repeat protein [Tannerella sp.]|jgi:tetratricopeptide (TPR) repeat protein|nr:tetratricopeptide repeat protein [Tannerella sp.]